MGSKEVAYECCALSRNNNQHSVGCIPLCVYVVSYLGPSVSGCGFLVVEYPVDFHWKMRATEQHGASSPSTLSGQQTYQRL